VHSAILPRDNEELWQGASLVVVDIDRNEIGA
jgi:hypothetical protein